MGYRGFIYDDVDFTMVPGDYIFFIRFNGECAGIVSISPLSRALLLLGPRVSTDPEDLIFPEWDFTCAPSKREVHRGNFFLFATASLLTLNLMAVAMIGVEEPSGWNVFALSGGLLQLCISFWDHITVWTLHV